MKVEVRQESCSANINDRIYDNFLGSTKLIDQYEREP